MSQITKSRHSGEGEVFHSGRKITDRGMKAICLSCHLWSVSGVESFLYFFKTLLPEGIHKAQVYTGTTRWKDLGVIIESLLEGQPFHRDSVKDSEYEIHPLPTLSSFHLQEFSIHSPGSPRRQVPSQFGVYFWCFPRSTGYCLYLKAWLPAKSVFADMCLD